MRNFKDIRVQRHADVPFNLGSNTTKTKIKNILNDPLGYKVSDEYNHDDVRGKLIQYFGIKCVYCESSPIATSTFRIDHFRPKKHIKELPKLSHKGYYWLAYEWTNFVQSCQLCNQSKSNHFPLVNETTRLDESYSKIKRKQFRKLSGIPLNKEKRLLLHPELDETENYFIFHEDGTVVSVKDEGKKSIKIYDLNRDDLIFWRNKIVDEYTVKIKNKLIDYEEDIRKGIAHAKDTLFRGLRDYFREWLKSYSNRNEIPYSMLYFFMFHHFSDFFIRHIPDALHSALLNEAYMKYKAGTL
jgi:uncharacterized protein (TIGR02646 family)